MGSANQATISVTDILQKYSLANVCESVLGVNFNVLDDKQSLMHEKIKYVKLQIFNPIFLNFLILTISPFQAGSRQEEK